MVMKNLGMIKILTLISAMLVIGSGAAEAAAPTTVGDMVTNATASFAKFPFILSMISYFSGLFLAIAGIFKFKDHVDNPMQNPLSAGVKRFLAGGMFLSTPFMYEAIYNTLFAGAGTQISRTGQTAGGGGGGGSLSLDEMVVNFMADVSHPIELLLISFSYISAIALLLVGISRLTKRLEEGPRGPAGMGTMMTFFASGALFAFGDMMGTFSSSLFGDASVQTMADIDPAVGLSAADELKVVRTIEGVMTFIMLVGYIAFIRGWFVLKSFADNGESKGASLSQGLVFLFGGTLAINLGELVNVLQATVGISGITFT
jgi:hypothetical protein